MRLGGILLAAALMAAGGRAAQGQEAAARIMAMPAGELAALVAKADASTFERAKAIERLGMVGGADATRVLAAQLGNEELNAYARSALEAIGDEAADAALREAAGKLQGRPLVGVIDSIGQRRDEQAVVALTGLLKSGDADVRSAAAVALGQIGSEASAAALKTALAGDAAAVPSIGDAVLVCADRLAAAHPDAAGELYEQLIKAPVAKPVRLAAMLGRVRVNPDGTAKWIGEQLAAKDLDGFQVALTAARESDRDDVGAALMAAMKSATPQRQALLLPALAERQGHMPLEWLVEKTGSDSAELRAAVVEALANRPGPEAAGALVTLALSDGPAAPIALQRVKASSNAEVDRAIVAQAVRSDVKPSAAFVELAGARGVAELKELVAELASHGDAEMKRAAIVSLGQLGELADLDLIIEQALGGGDAADVQAARTALRTAARRLGDREACARRLVKELGKSPDQRDYLLKVLREMGAGCQTALDAVTAAAKSSDAVEKEAGTRELGAWPTAAAGPALLDLAKNDAQEKYRIRALRGYIRIARQLQLSDAERLAAFRTALEVAQRDEERRLALGILERVPSVESLELATGYLDKPAMASAAAETAVKVAGRLILNEPAAVAAAMRQVKGAAGVTLAPATAQIADGLLQRAGGQP